MKFGELTDASARLRNQHQRAVFEKMASLHQQGIPVDRIAELYAPHIGMTKEALLGAIAKGIGFGKNVVTKAMRGAVGTASKAVTAPVTAPAKWMLNWAKKRPLTAAFAGLSVLDAAGQARKAGGAHSQAMAGIKQQGAMRRLGSRMSRIDPTHDLTPMSGF